ncbi:hypothetical protein [Longimicrobium sp.]|uniref:hypothetical protein n=1 Tax=Longimicrobium sp. TaxID=2029185 RepID=UPI002E2F69B5|nr:hypothetical protein [Longimicrobium sp.]HEX6037459.1 hypothetical protein [Longimicrobium sp.]
MKPCPSIIRPLLLCAALLASALAPPHRASAQVPDSAAARDTLYEIRLTDGSVLYGHVTRNAGDEVEIVTQAGATVRLRRGQIASITATEARVVAGRVWPRDPNATRLFFGPTARAVGAGRGYLGVYEVLFPFLTYGVTDNFSISGGTPIVPDVIGELWYVAPKLTLVETETMAAAAGVLMAGDDGDVVGVAYGVGTYGGPDRSVTAGVGFGFSGDEFSNQPVAMIGGELRTGASTKLITENYFAPGEDGVVVSGGVRFFGERLSADLGIATSLDADEFFPLVNFVYSF